MAENKKTLRHVTQERFQQEVARELGIDLNGDESIRPPRAPSNHEQLIADGDTEQE